jgi:periplasmic protein TonB
MKKYLISALILLNVALNGQKVLLDKFREPVADTSAALYYRIIGPPDNQGLFKENHFYITGEKESEYYFRKSDGKNLQEGRWLSWYKNGQLKSEIDHSNDQYSRIVTTYWSNGEMKRQDYFKKNNLEKGTCFDSIGNKIPHFDFEIFPDYPGGGEKLLSFIENRLNYPYQSAAQGIQGKVILRLGIDEKGSISNITVIKGLNAELNEEAIRVIKKIKKFIPASNDGESVAAFSMIPITFRLK